MASSFLPTLRNEAVVDNEPANVEAGSSGCAPPLNLFRLGDWRLAVEHIAAAAAGSGKRRQQRSS